MEHLRHVAAARGADPAALAAETASALAHMCHDPGALVVTARRMLERQPGAAPLWWACASIVTALDPCAECSSVARRLHDDPTVDVLASAVADVRTLCAVGWSGHLVEALAGLPDDDAGPEVLVVDSHGDGRDMLAALAAAGASAIAVPAEGAGEAARAADAVVLPVAASGPSDLLAPAGSLALAATAYVSGTAVWAVVPRGTRLPQRLWEHMASLWQPRDEPWRVEMDVVPRALISHVAGPDGSGSLAGRPGLLDAECPDAPELLRRSAL